MPDALLMLRDTLAARYRLDRELGAGGMATVYLAHDLKHDRDVAIKVLRPDLARSLTGERFLREIAITAKLNHPHILTLLDSGEAGDGECLYYVMPVVTGESLRELLARDGALPVADAIRFATEVVDALMYAHSQNVLHRDIKPDNVLLSGGHAVLVDFGIAKAIGSARRVTTITMAGASLGTPDYMAPEQAAGEDDVNHRADLYAVGVLLYEMLTGAPPFTGEMRQVVIEKMAKEAPSVAIRRADIPPRLVELVAQCLSRDPAARPASAAAVRTALLALAAPPAAARGLRARLPWMIGAVATVALAGAAFQLMRDRRTRYVYETAVPTIQRLVDADQLDSAFALASSAAARVPGDSVVDALWAGLSQTQTFLSEPAGATVSRASVNNTTRWIAIGTTPTAPVRIPKNAWFYRYEKSGFRTVTVMGARIGGSYVPIPAVVPLRRITAPDSGMVMLRGGRLTGTLYGLPERQSFALSDFLMDKLEVTNRQYKAFVDSGGYATPRWWDSSIVRNGKALRWSEAMTQFVDKSGRPGPAAWEAGAPVEGTDDLPVGGVSWYEAQAYARFSGKALPTVIEWNAAAIPEAARWVVPHGRYDATSAVRGGAARSVGPRGVYDMAGNVREWTVNAREPESRYTLGGGWTDPPYLFSELYAQPAFDRAAINGIRLIRRLAAGTDLARASAPIPGLVRDYKRVRPVDDATFRGFLSLYEYDHTPLNVRVTARDSSKTDWVREDVTFDLPAGAGRMHAVLFLPRRITPPYQTVVIFPATDAQILRNPAKLSMSFVDYFARSGRAVLYPIYEHTYGRGTSMAGDFVTPTIAHRDQMLRWATEMRRSIDYAVTRPEIDSTRLAYAGTSWGARLGGVLVAIEPRFRAAVLNVPGLNMSAMRPEEDPVNFLPRIRVPVLMLSGKYDSVFPYELSQRPFYDLLPALSGKKHIVFEGGHFLPRNLMVNEALKWLDQYLGPVSR